MNTKRDRRRVSGYFRRKFSGGRGTAARVTDYIVIRAILLLALRLWFTAVTDNSVAGWLLTLAAWGALIVAMELIRGMRFTRFCEKERERLRREAFCESLSLTSEDEFFGIVQRYIRANECEFSTGAYAAVLHRAEPVTVNDIASVYRRVRQQGGDSCYIFSPSGPCREAEAFAARLDGVTARFIQPAMLMTVCEAAGLLVLTDDRLDKRILALREADMQARKKRLSAPFTAGSPIRYIICASGLFAASFISAYPLYMRLLAAACVGFASCSYLLRAVDRSHGAAV